MILLRFEVIAYFIVQHGDLLPLGEANFVVFDAVQPAFGQLKLVGRRVDGRQIELDLFYGRVRAVLIVFGTLFARI